MAFNYLFQFPQRYRLVQGANENLKTPRGQYYAKAMMSELVPPYGAYLRTMDAMHEMDNALALYGLGYEDIRYITKTVGFRSAGSLPSSTLNYVSSNVNRLYRK